jgi:hypothetical protein
MFNNGLVINQSCIHYLHLNLNNNTTPYNDFEDFMKCYKPVADEEELMPAFIEKVKLTYGNNSFLGAKNNCLMLQPYIRNYSSIEVKNPPSYTIL